MTHGGHPLRNWMPQSNRSLLASAEASSSLVAEPMFLIFRLRHSSNISEGGIPKMKLSTGTPASMAVRICVAKS